MEQFGVSDVEGWVMCGGDGDGFLRMME
jgi:hypothetical protein